MSVRIRAAAFGVLAALVPVVSANAEEMKAEVIHWWTSGGESAAVRVFAERFEAAGGTWVDTAIAGGANARTAAVNRVVAGNPPTAMQFNTGKQFDDLIANELLNDVDAAAAEGDWRRLMPPVLIEASTRGGKMYAVPVSIHGQNWLWYNAEALRKAGAEPPTDWDDIFVTLDKLKAAGVIPLALGGQKTWERQLFNVVLLGKGGRDLYVDIYTKRDPALVDTPQFRAVAETYGRLRGYVDQGSPGRSWNDTTRLVITGEAGMQVMGDWAKGEFTAAGMVPGKDYGCVVPSSDGSFMIGGDVFVFAKTDDPAQIKAQQALAKVLVEPETQIEFSLKKGSVPVRPDVDTSRLDTCAQKAMRWLADPEGQVANVEILAPPALNGALEDVISAYWNTPGETVDEFVQHFRETLQAPL